MTIEYKMSVENQDFLKEIHLFEARLNAIAPSVSTDKRLELMRPFEKCAAQLALSKGWHLETEEAETQLVRNIKIGLSILESEAEMRHKLLNINDLLTM